MIYRYFISYYWRNSFFSRGFGWAEFCHNKKLFKGDDILEAQELMKIKYNKNKVIITNFVLFECVIDSSNPPFRPCNDRA
jgi:hypothetical protein